MPREGDAALSRVAAHTDHLACQLHTLPGKHGVQGSASGIFVAPPAIITLTCCTPSAVSLPCPAVPSVHMR